jgi:hypothetical protein
MKPIMAKDLREKINQFDPRIDEFISKECEPFFMQGEDTIRVAYTQLFPYDIELCHFIRQLQMRGFIATYHCERLPCGECWVEIILP